MCIKKVFYWIFFSICCLILLSCTNKRNEVLDELDKLIYTDPTQALAKADSLTSHFAQAGKHDKMLLALLKYKAEDKCYIPHTSDSTINVLYDYFERNGSPHEKLEIYYYMGRTYKDIGDNPQAISWFNQALNIAESNLLSREDSLILPFIHSQLAGVYDNIGLCQEPYKHIKKSFEMQKRLGIVTIKTYEDVAHCAEAADSIDAATHFYRLCALEIVEKRQIAKYLDLLGEQLGFFTETRNELFAKWIYGILEGIDKDSLPCNTLSTLGEYHEQLTHNTDSALTCYRLALDKEPRMIAKMDIARSIAMLQLKRGEQQDAIQSFLDFFCYGDSAKEELKIEETEAADKNFYAEELAATRQMKKEEDRHKMLVLTFSASICLLLIAIICLVLYLGKKKQLKLLRAQIRTAEERDLLAEKHHELTAFVEADQKMRAENAPEITAVIRKLQETGSTPKEKLLPENWNEVFNAVDAHYPAFRSGLLSLHAELESKDLILLYLVKLGFKQSDIARITKTTRSTVCRKFTRIESLLGHPIYEVNDAYVEK